MVCQEERFSQSRSILHYRRLPRPLAFLLEEVVELLRPDYMAVLAAERRTTVKAVGVERSQMAGGDARQVEKRVRCLHWAEREMLFLCLM